MIGLSPLPPNGLFRPPQLALAEKPFWRVKGVAKVDRVPRTQAGISRILEDTRLLRRHVALGEEEHLTVRVSC